MAALKQTSSQVGMSVLKINRCLSFSEWVRRRLVSLCCEQLWPTAWERSATADSIALDPSPTKEKRKQKSDSCGQSGTILCSHILGIYSSFHLQKVHIYKPIKVILHFPVGTAIPILQQRKKRVDLHRICLHSTGTLQANPRGSEWQSVFCPWLVRGQQGFCSRAGIEYRALHPKALIWTTITEITPLDFIADE